MSVFIANSAVIPPGAFGAYAYTEATLEELKTAMERPHTSYLDSLLRLELIEEWTGVQDQWNGEPFPGLKPDEIAFVIRLKPGRQIKEGVPVSHNITDWEIGRLKRLA